MSFLARGAGYSVFLTPREAVLSLSKPQPPPAPGALRREARGKDTGAVVRMRMLGANQHPKLVAAAPLPGKTNYLVGRDAKRWHSGVAHYAKVSYKGVYPGTDVVYYGGQERLEYDFVLAPGAHAEAISLGFEGVRRLAVDARGDLLLNTAVGTLRQHRPVAYQQLGGRRRAVSSRYVLRGAHRVGVSLGAYDRTKPLVIDPTLDYSTYLGGTNHDQGNAIAVDGSGSAYITGVTGSSDFPTKNAYDPTPNNVFVAKFNLAGSALDYATYLGGTDFYDYGLGIAVDTSGAAYITGYTRSRDFPTKNAFDSTGPIRGVKAFLTKLNPSGSGLDYSTYLGSPVGVTANSQGDTFANAVAVDASGNAYLTGNTTAVDFPTKNAYDLVLGGLIDGFAAKFDPSKSGADSLVYSTFLGGNGFTEGLDGIAVDDSGSAYVTGTTDADDYPTKNAYQSQRGGGACGSFACPNAVVTKFKPDGRELDYSTYLGSTDRAIGRDIAVDSSGAAYVTGEGTVPTTPGAFQRGPRTGTDFLGSFVTKLKPAGNELDYSTLLGGGASPGGNPPSGGYDYATGIALDSCGSAYVTGSTNSTNFPTKDAVQGAYGGTADPSGPPPPNLFITKLNSAGSALDYSTYLGGKNSDAGSGIAVNPATGTAYVTGLTGDDLPTKNPFQGYRGNGDALVAALSASFTPCAAPSITPAIAISDATVIEGNAGPVTATFTISLSASPTKPVSVRYATADDTAKAPEDYTPASGTVSFSPGETNKTVTVAVQDDHQFEQPAERFFVNLSDPVNATIADSQGIGTIIDDDQPPPRGGGQGTTTGPGPGTGTGPGPGTGVPPGSGPCVTSRGFASVNGRANGGGLELGFSRLSDAPVLVEIFQSTAGALSVGAPRVAVFRDRSQSFAWNGRRGRRRGVADGYYWVRYRIAGQHGRADVRREAYVRRHGRFSRLPEFSRADNLCGLISSFGLSAPAFGGPTTKSLNVAFHLVRRGNVTVALVRGRRVLRTVTLRRVVARRTYTVRFSARHRRRGNYQVRILARSGRLSARDTLTARRL